MAIARRLNMYARVWRTRDFMDLQEFPWQLLGDLTCMLVFGEQEISWMLVFGEQEISWICRSFHGNC